MGRRNRGGPCEEERRLSARAEVGVSPREGVDVFVSYSRADEEFVRSLDEALRDRGKEVWGDWEEIPATADWRAWIFKGIDASRVFVA
jgi:TIR domain